MMSLVFSFVIASVTTARRLATVVVITTFIASAAVPGFRQLAVVHSIFFNIMPLTVIFFMEGTGI